MIETFNQHRQLLFGIAYRMLGSVAGAEDQVQETWLRWQKQDAATIQSPKSWLVATLTRLCIDQLRSARHQREEYYGVWLPEPLVGDTAAAPDQTADLADSLSMAFMLMLETLNPVERAVFLLREVFDYEYADIAAVVDKSEANCRQIIRRAKAELLIQPHPTGLPDARARRVVEEFMSATATGNMDNLLAVLTEDATLYSDGGGKVQAARHPIQTALRVSRFFKGIQPRWPADLTVRYVGINGRPGALMFSGGQIYNAVAFELQGNRVHRIFIVRNPEKLQHLAPIFPHESRSN
ncbi:MAG TPA: RNA polymerase sigma-70 factor [Dongiaceae bacterium]|jgi:RNA polymerase sigma-70 factor (ECF subfamily)|nr:RNA polymerase sigma-70 factor [Dongiaceae bacterium]